MDPSHYFLERVGFRTNNFYIFPPAIFDLVGLYIDRAEPSGRAV
jgi:hypothetical protein